MELKENESILQSSHYRGRVQDRWKEAELNAVSKQTNKLAIKETSQRVNTIKRTSTKMNQCRNQPRELFSLWVPRKQT